MYENSSLLTTAQTSPYGQFAPLVIVQKTNTLSSTQVDTLLGGVLKAMKTKWVIFWLFLAFGVVILGVGIFMCIKSRQLFAAAEGGGAADGKVNATRDASAAGAALMADNDE